MMNIKSEPPTLFTTFTDLDLNLDPFGQRIEWTRRNPLTGKTETLETMLSEYCNTCFKMDGDELKREENDAIVIASSGDMLEYESIIKLPEDCSEIKLDPISLANPTTFYMPTSYCHTLVVNEGQ